MSLGTSKNKREDKAMIKIYFELSKHIEMWNWLAKNPDKRKSDWPGWKSENNFILKRNYCFACASVYSGFDTLCQICPIKWPLELISDRGLTAHCDKPGSPYHEWVSLHRKMMESRRLESGEPEKLYAELCKLAKQIADLPIAYYHDVEINVDQPSIIEEREREIASRAGIHGIRGLSNPLIYSAFVPADTEVVNIEVCFKRHKYQEKDHSNA